MITLDDVTLELIQANDTLGALKVDSNLQLEFMNLTVDTFKEGFSNLLSFFQGNSLANLEKAREDKEFQNDMLDALKDLKQKDNYKMAAAPKEMEGFGLGALGLLLAGLIGIVKGYVSALKTFVKAFTPESILASFKDKIAKISTTFVKIIDDFKMSFSTGFNVLRSKLVGFISGLSMQFDLLKDSKFGKYIDNIRDIAKTVMGPITSAFEYIRSAAKTLASVFVSGGEAIKTLTAGPVKFVVETVKGWISTFKTFAGALGRVSSILGKIFAPIFIIMTVYDTVKGMLKGFEEGGIIGAIGGAIKGFFNSLIMAPLDMIKSAVSWIAGAFGFENVEKALDSFSFEDLFTKLIDGIFGAITNAIDWVVGLFTGKTDFGASLGSAMDGIKDFYKKILQAILPMPDSTKPWYSIPNLISKAIPDSIYEFAGINPKTGAPTDTPANSNLAGGPSLNSPTGASANSNLAGGPSLNSPTGAPSLQYDSKANPMLSAPSQGGAAITSGNDLNLAKSEQSQLSSPAQGGGGGGGINQTNSTSVVNNQTTVIKPTPSATRRPNNASDVFYYPSASSVNFA